MKKLLSIIRYSSIIGISKVQQFQGLFGGNRNLRARKILENLLLLIDMIR